MNKAIIDLDNEGRLRGVGGITTKADLRGQFIELKEFLKRLER